MGAGHKEEMEVRIKVNGKIFNMDETDDLRQST